MFNKVQILTTEDVVVFILTQFKLTFHLSIFFYHRRLIVVLESINILLPQEVDCCINID